MSCTNQNNPPRQPDESLIVINSTDQSTYTHTKAAEDNKITNQSTTATSCEDDNEVKVEDDIDTPEFWYRCFGQMDSNIESYSYESVNRVNAISDMNNPQFWHECFGRNSSSMVTVGRGRQILDDLFLLEKIVSYGWKRLSY